MSFPTHPLFQARAAKAAFVTVSILAIGLTLLPQKSTVLADDETAIGMIGPLGEYFSPPEVLVESSSDADIPDPHPTPDVPEVYWQAEPYSRTVTATVAVSLSAAPTFDPPPTLTATQELPPTETPPWGASPATKTPSEPSPTPTASPTYPVRRPTPTPTPTWNGVVPFFIPPTASHPDIQKKTSLLAPSTRPAQRAPSISDGLRRLLSVQSATENQMTGSGYQHPTAQGEVGEWTGAAIASIPIAVLPGPADTEPQLSLNYSSNTVEDVLFQGALGTGNETYHFVQSSPFGYGWNLSGIPAIHQVPKSQVAFSDSCFGYELSLGGTSVRLVQPQVDPGNPYRTLYQTYPQSFLYVARYRGQAAPLDCDDSPGLEDRWVVKTRDGTRYEFGAGNNLSNVEDRNAVQEVKSTSAITVPLAWYATGISTTTGNQTWFFYRRESVDGYDAAVTPMTITYGFTDGHRAMVRFVEQSSNRQDCDMDVPGNTTAFTCSMTSTPGNGSVLRSKKLIDRIEVLGKDKWNNWSGVRVYNLSYIYKGQGGRKRALLDTVTLANKPTGSPNYSALPDYHMTYRHTEPITDFKNWVPLETFDNGYGAITEFSYHSDLGSLCRGPSGGDPTLHPRRPVKNKSIDLWRLNQLLPTSIVTYTYDDQRCTQKFTSQDGLYSWYEFLGYGKVTTQHADKKQTTSSADDEEVETVTNVYYQCREDNSCLESDNGNQSVEPHPNKGEIKLHQVRKRYYDPVRLQRQASYTSTVLNTGYFGLPITSSALVNTLWGYLQYTIDSASGLSNAVGSTYLTTTKVTTFEYDPLKQGGKRWISDTDTTKPYMQFGNVTHVREFPSLSAWSPYFNPTRTTTNWYYPKLSFPASSNSTFIIDRVAAKAIYTGTSTSAAAAVTLNYYDGNSSHLSGPNTQGLLTKSSNLEQLSSIAAVPGGAISGCNTSLPYVVYRSTDRTTAYTAQANPRDAKTFTDYGHICVMNPTLITATTAVSVPTQSRLTVTDYDPLLYALPVTRTSPAVTQGGLTLVNRWEYFGINSLVVTDTPGYFLGNLARESDPNSVATDYEHDPFGRLEKVLKQGDYWWSPTIVHSRSDWGDDNGFQPPFPFMVMTWQKREPDGTPFTSEGSFYRHFFDGLGREIQVQSQHDDWITYGGNGHEVIVDTEFDARSLKIRASNPYTVSQYYNTCAPLTCNPYITPSITVSSTRTSYDVLRRPEFITNADGTILQHHYGVRPDLADWPSFDDVVDENRHRKQWVTDSLGRMFGIAEIAGNCGDYWTAYTCTGSTTQAWDGGFWTNFTYNILDQVTKSTDVGGNETVVGYDMLGRKMAQFDPDLGLWTFRYDAAGNLTRQRDARGQATCLYYDDLDRLKGKHYTTDSTCPSSPTLSPAFTYDETSGGSFGLGHRSHMTDTTGNTHWYFDDRGRPITETRTVSGSAGGVFTTTKSYKANDALFWMKYPVDNEQIVYAYNPVGMGTLTGDGGSALVVADTGYRPTGQVDWRYQGSNSNNTLIATDYYYDPQSNRLSTVQTGYSGNSQLQYDLLGYDNAGNITGISDLTGFPTIRSQSMYYDHLNRLITAFASGLPSQGGYLEEYYYSSNGNRSVKTGLQYAYNTPYLSYSSPPPLPTDKPHAVKRVFGTGNSQGSFVPGTVKIRAKKDAATCGATQPYLYLYVNSQYHGFTQITDTVLYTATLTPDLSGHDVLDLEYLELSNPGCKVLIDQVHVSSTLGSGLYQVEGGTAAIGVGGGPWVSGNLEATASHEVADGAATVVTMTSWSNLRLAVGSGTAAFDYDANGNTTWRFNEGNAYNLVWDAANRLSAVKRNTETLATFGYDGDDNRITATLGTTESVFIGDYYEKSVNGGTTGVTKYYTANDRRVALRRSGFPSNNGLHWIISDHLGSTKKVVAGHTILGEERYKAFGETRYEDPAGGVPTAVRFTGQRQDANIGLYFYNARYYDPAIGRFISPDTVVPDPRDPQDLNRYSYVRSNPVTRNDPSGHCIGGVDTAVCGAIIAMFVTMLTASGEQDLGPERMIPAAAGGYLGGQVMGSGTALLGNGFRASVAVGSVSSVAGGQASRATANVIAGRSPTEGLGEASEVASDALLGGLLGGGFNVLAELMVPPIKPGSVGGLTAGKAIPRRVKDAAFRENPGVCVLCGRWTAKPQYDHAIPRVIGGNATLENTQVTCGHCNASKGARAYPVTPPRGYRGRWPRW